jgi:hypothetical protein
MYKYDLLKTYINTHKKYPVEGTLYMSVNMGTFVTSIRQSYMKGKLSNSRINLMERLDNWKWVLRNKSQWDINYQLLKNYVDTNHKIPPISTQCDNIKLGTWVSEQRRRYIGTGSSKIAQSQIELLEQIPGWWWVYRESLEVTRQKRITNSTETIITTKSRGGNQKKFRENTLKRFNNKCLITGVSQIETLEAAHIVPNCDSKDVESSYNDNSLLLISDLHKLFDCYNFSINPDTLKIEIVNELDPYYTKLLTKNKKVKFKFNEAELANLRIHYNKFNSQFT